MNQRRLFHSAGICLLFLFCGIMRLTGSLPFSLTAACLLYGAGRLSDRFL